MNSFFASCEQVKNPELKGKPIAVVGDPNRRSGIVLAASYEAKAYGVKTTMPIYQAKACCKDIILIGSSHGLYGEMSKKVMKIFDLYTPLKEQVSIDEAFLDMTGTRHLFGRAKEAAARIQQHIYKELDLGCSVGISTNKLLAKMASDMKKPLGITTLFHSEIKEKMWPMPVGELHGIGRRTVPKLKTLGIHTIGDLANIELNILYGHFGEKGSLHMHNCANGVGSNSLIPSGTVEVKSVGNELTYAADITSLDKIKNEVLLLADTVGHRLRRKMLKGRTLQIKIKYNDFTVITRNKTFEMPTDSTDFIFEQAFELIKVNRGKKPIRLLGISLSHFESEICRQLTLFDDKDSYNSKKIDSMVDQVREKYGYKAINRASILDRKHGKL